MDNPDPMITDAAIAKLKKNLKDIAEMQAETYLMAPMPWIGHVTCRAERRRAEEWAKAMGTGYPSPQNASLIEQGYQNPSSEPKGEQVEPGWTGNAETAQDKQDKA